MESHLSALKHKLSKGVTPKITESPPPVSGARAKAGAGLEPDAGPPGTRPNIGQTEEPRGNIKKVSETEKPASDLGENLPVTTPMVSAAESPLVSRTTECSPNVEGSVDRNSALGAKKQGTVRKDARNFTFNEAEAKKIEERNREMKERLKRIKERKATTANLLSKERTPKPQPSSSRTDGTSAAPQPKKSGPKRTQPASQLRNLQPKNKKNFTFDDKKVEDIRSQNQELRERLKRIKKRKLPSDTQGINQPRRAFHWCVRLHEDNLSSWHCVDILLNPLIRTARIGGLRRLTFPQPGKGRLMCATAKTLQPQIEEECSQPAAASGSNDVISEDEVPSIIPTVGSVCPPSRTDEHNLFSENRSLTREKEHEGEAVEAFNNLECEKHEAASKEEVPKVIESNRLATSCANHLTTIANSTTPFFKDKEPVKELSIEECESSHDKEFFASDEASEVNYNAPKQVKKLRKRREFFDAIRKAAVRRRILTEEVNSRIAGPNLAPPASRHIVKKELPNSNGYDRPNLKIDEIHAKVNHVEEVLERLNEKCHHSKTEPVIITTKEEISKWFEEAGLFSLNSNSNKQPPIPGPSFRRSAQTSRAFKASDNPPRNPNSSHPRNDSASNDDHTQRRNLSEEVNSPIAGPNLHAPPASEHRQEEELPNSNRNDGPNYTLDTIYAKMNRVGEELDTLIQQRQTENQKEIIQQPISEAYNEPSASGTNDGSIGVVVKSIAPTVSSVCPSSRTDESQSLRKKEHEVGATEAYGNQEYDNQGKTLVEKNSQNDGSSLAPPKHMKFSEKELPRSENQNLMNTNRYRNCEELLDKVRDTISLLNTQGKASLELSNPQNHGSSSAPPHYKKCSEKELPPSENRILMDIIWRIYCDELYEKVREIFPHLNIQGTTLDQVSSLAYATKPEWDNQCESEGPELTSMVDVGSMNSTFNACCPGGEGSEVSVKGTTLDQVSSLAYATKPEWDNQCESEGPELTSMVDVGSMNSTFNACCPGGEGSEVSVKGTTLDQVSSLAYATKPEWDNQCESEGPELTSMVDVGSMNSTFNACCPGGEGSEVSVKGTTLDQVSSLAYATKPEWDNQCESEGPELTSMVDVGSMNSTFNACCPGGEGSEVSVKGTTLDQVSSLAYATKPEWDNQCESEGPELTSMVDVGSMNSTFNACCPGGEGSEVSVKGTTLDQVSSLAYATKPEWDNQCESEGPELTSMVDVGSMNSTFNACCPGGEGSEVSVKGTTLDQVSSLAYATKPEWDNQCESEGPELTSMVDVGSMNSTFNACCPGGEGSEVSVKGTTLDQVSSLAYATKPEWDNQCESEGPELTSMVDVGSMNSTFNACCPGGEGSEVSVKGTTLDQVSSLAYATKPEWDNQCESEGPELTSMVDVGSMNSTFNACCPGGEGSEVSVKGTTLDQVSSLAYATKPEWDNQCESEGPELTSMVDVGSMNSTFNACCPGGEGSEVSVKGTTLDQVSSLAYATKPEWDNQCESEGPELTSMVDVGSMNSTFNACCPGGEGSEVSVKGTTLDQVSSLAYATKPEWDNQCESEGPELTSMVDVGSMNSTFNACCPGGEGSEVSVKGTTLDQVSSLAYATKPEWDNQCESEGPELTSMVDVGSMNSTFNACCPGGEGSEVSVKGTTLDQVSSLAYATKPEWDNQCESEGPELTSMVDVGSMNSTFNACCPGGEGSEVSVKGTTLDQVSSLAYATKPEWDNQCESEGPELTSMVDVGSMNSTFNACCPGGEGSEVSVKGTTLDQVSSLAYATKPEWDNQCESEGPELTSMVDVGSMNGTFNACCPGGEGSEVSVKGTTLDQVSSLAYATKPEWDNQCESEGPELTSMVDVGSMNSTFNACCPGGEGSEVSVKGTTLDQVSSLAYATKPEWDNQCESEGPELTSMVDVGSMNSTFNACCPGGEGSEVSVKGTTLDQVSSVAYATTPEWNNQCESESPELTSMVDVESMNDTFNACCPESEGSDVSVKNRGGSTCDCCIITKYFASALKSARIAVGAREALPAANPALGGVQTRVMQAGSPV
ncbi:hypothetical protein AAG570_007366 [Ranatra chinensis]|uniref:Uncharacterized protein n=1 Tax=Ranatra chinensis TaxID=642074 RepID=A0ABD0XVN2_9HEMI